MAEASKRMRMLPPNLSFLINAADALMRATLVLFVFGLLVRRYDLIAARRGAPCRVAFPPTARQPDHARIVTSTYRYKRPPRKRKAVPMEGQRSLLGRSRRPDKPRQRPRLSLDRPPSRRAASKHTADDRT
jgi:hypothetical protein